MEFFYLMQDAFCSDSLLIVFGAFIFVFFLFFIFFGVVFLIIRWLSE